MLYARRTDKVVGFLKVRRISTKKGRLERRRAYTYLLRKDLSLREHIMVMLMIAASRAIATPDTTRWPALTQKRFREEAGSVVG